MSIHAANAEAICCGPKRNSQSACMKFIRTALHWAGLRRPNPTTLNIIRPRTLISASCSPQAEYVYILGYAHELALWRQSSQLGYSYGRSCPTPMERYHLLFCTFAQGLNMSELSFSALDPLRSGIQLLHVGTRRKRVMWYDLVWKYHHYDDSAQSTSVDRQIRGLADL